MDTTGLETREVRGYERLNAAQHAAVTYGVPGSRGAWLSGPLLIIAGAGTGKTNTLAHRVAYLVLNGVAPEKILLMTFSRRASQEMIRRARRIVAQDLSGSDNTEKAPAVARLTWSGTFHSVANRIIRRFSEQLGLSPSFSVVDRGDSADLLDLGRQALGFASRERRFPRKDTCLAIYSHCVNTRDSLERTLTDVFPWCVSWGDELKRLFGRYVEMKLAQQVLDFDDLLLYWHALMQEPALAREVNALFDHVLVDEYQDTNRLQAEILLALKPDGRGLAVVGDDAQSIYSFRAATVENILGFPQHFAPAAHVLTLEDNYRSTQPILDAANALIAGASRQYRKRLKAQRAKAPGNRPRLVTVLDEQAQADYVVERVLGAREEGTPLRQQAVLFRSAHHSDLLELELTRRNIPYVKYGGLKFLDAAHVKDMLAVLRWAENPRNRIAGFRVLQLLSGVGPSGAEKCLDSFEASAYDWSALASRSMRGTPGEEWAALMVLMAALTAPQRRWEGQVGLVARWYEPHLTRLHDAAAARAADVEQLERIAPQFLTREQFLTELTLDPPRASSDFAGPPLLDEDYLILSTIHSAKGQEWDRVSILHVSDGTFPSEFATGKPELIEEERRLLYVAMTRAKRELDLIAPLKFYLTQQGTRGDAHVYGTPSRFLTHAVMDTLDRITWPVAISIAEAPVATLLPCVDIATQLKNRWS
jgi:DNA helicase-2/ATP-dependent DNA helicase PcrA